MVHLGLTFRIRKAVVLDCDQVGGWYNQQAERGHGYCVGVLLVLALQSDVLRMLWLHYL